MVGLGDGEIEAIEGVDGGDGIDGGDGNTGSLVTTGLMLIGSSKLACCSFAGSGSRRGRK